MLDEDALWKVYENKQYGFKLKYPNSWSVSEIDFDRGGEIFKLVFRSQKNQKLINQAKAEIDAGQGDSGAYDADFFYNDLEIDIFNKNLIPVNNPIDKVIGKTMLGNKNATEYWMGGYGSYYAVVVEDDGIFFQFGFKGCDTEECIKNRELSIELKQMLNSFEFIK